MLCVCVCVPVLGSSSINSPTIVFMEVDKLNLTIDERGSYNCHPNPVND